MFKTYESRPILRQAVEITEECLLEKVPLKHLTWKYTKGPFSITFRCLNEPPTLGDFIVYLNEGDVYHCTREVFLERNIVE